jgi:uncharacterized protein YaiL (DUF2058 family)
MSMSLRDQLLQVGLISQKQAKEAERQADRQAEQHRHQHSKQKHPKHKGAAPASKTAPTNSSTPKTTTTPAVMTSSAPAAVPAPARPVPAHASAQAAKVARDQALSRKQQEKAQKKALQAQIKQLIEQNRLPQAPSDEPYNFVDDGKIRRITINAANRGALTRGEIFIVRHEGRYDLVPATIAARIRERDVTAVVTIVAAGESAQIDDAYKGFEVPDDLIW